MEDKNEHILEVIEVEADSGDEAVDVHEEDQSDKKTSDEKKFASLLQLLHDSCCDAGKLGRPEVAYLSKPQFWLNAFWWWAWNKLKKNNKRTLEGLKTGWETALRSRTRVAVSYNATQRMNAKNTAVACIFIKNEEEKNGLKFPPEGAWEGSAQFPSLVHIDKLIAVARLVPASDDSDPEVRIECLVPLMEFKQAGGVRESPRMWIKSSEVLGFREYHALQKNQLFVKMLEKASVTCKYVLMALEEQTPKRGYRNDNLTFPGGRVKDWERESCMHAAKREFTEEIFGDFHFQFKGRNELGYALTCVCGTEDCQGDIRQCSYSRDSHKRKLFVFCGSIIKDIPDEFDHKEFLKEQARKKKAKKQREKKEAAKKQRNNRGRGRGRGRGGERGRGRGRRGRY